MGTGEEKGPRVSPGRDGGYAYTAVAEQSPDAADAITRTVSQCQSDYDLIVKKALVQRDIACDCWGALFYVVVYDIPAIRQGVLQPVGRARLVFCMIVFMINLFIQFILLYFICKLLMMPGILSAQNVYKFFTEDAFEDGVVRIALFDALDLHQKQEICGLALSQALFVRVILFLWITTNVGELKANYMKMKETLVLPALPPGLDPTMMVHDDPATLDIENSVICLDPASKMMLCVLIFIPKFIIASLLTTTGCVWLMAAENVGDLILNSLALAFVVCVDELIAQVYFPEFFLTELEHLALACQEEDLKTEELKTKHVFEFMYSGLILFSTMMVVELAIQFQPVIPNYKGSDVSEACLAFVASQVPWCQPGMTDCFQPA